MPKPNVREKIVAGGLDVLHRKGFHASTIDSIVDSAGVPKGSFYNHFTSKEDLALEVIGRYRAAIGHPVLVDHERPAIDRLREYFEYLADRFAGENYDKGCLLGNLANEMADHSPAIRVRLAAVFAEWTDLLAAVIREGQQRGEISSVQAPDRLAGFLLSCSEGAIIRSRCTRDGAAMEDFVLLAFSILEVP
ncbi:MAG: TetR family transcriptional regulator [Mycobacterium sp.]|jgi:TetR/AcrR family transcriptional repressor of nem operon|nr:TetR family transcriptional regulator [Mycobacterium sp.]